MENKEIQEIINLYNSKKLDLAEKEVIKLIKTEPNNSILFNILGAILTGKKRFDQAIINYKKSIKINPNYAEAYNNLGIALNEMVGIPNNPASAVIVPPEPTKQSAFSKYVIAFTDFEYNEIFVPNNFFSSFV